MNTLARLVLGAMMAVIVAAPAGAAMDGAPRAEGAARVLDGFENPADWRVQTADGVQLRVTSEPGVSGGALRIDYDFTRGSGFGIVRRELGGADGGGGVELPENYRFGYRVRGQGPRNTLEFKLVDPSGDNVWWVNQRDFDFPREWTPVTHPKRKIAFAWGPAGPGAPLRRVRAVEFAITASTGGKGTVWLDELTLEPLPPIGEYHGAPAVTASSTRDDLPPPTTLGPDGVLRWTPAPGDGGAALTIDFGAVRELGGLVADWAESAGPAGPVNTPLAAFRRYAVEASMDGVHFEKVGTSGGYGPHDYVPVPDLTARAVRLRMTTPLPQGVELTRLRFMPPAFGDSTNALLAAAAADARRGLFPRAFLGEATYWTVIGAPGDTAEALMSEDGAVEVGKGRFSVEPFVLVDGAGPPGAPGGRWLFTWADGASDQTLADGYLPIPTVTRSVGTTGLELRTTAFVDGEAGRSVLVIRQELINRGAEARSGRLFAAVRPMQVNPPYQNLNMEGGWAPLRAVGQSSDTVEADGTPIWPLVPCTDLRATIFSWGEIAGRLAGPPSAWDARADGDPAGLASGALGWPFRLGPGERLVVGLAVPMHAGAGAGVMETARSGGGTAWMEERLAATVAHWREALSRVTLTFPKGHERLADSVRANLAYILINRDGPAIQPGSRCYERTWIRDGSLTSAALLALGHAEEVREFLDWFAPFQYDNGKIPCCADARGPDPVPEHDSHGQYIFAVRNYYEHTGDTDFLKRHWPRVVRAVDYMESLRATRLTPEFASGPPEKSVLHGLLPESISHEGYSAKPMHSYWDDFFALKGLTDTEVLAAAVGDSAQLSRIARLRDDFLATLIDSIALAMSFKGVPYVPGCAELGDFDATSTTVALWPCGLREAGLGDPPHAGLPRGSLAMTFAKYWESFVARRDGQREWKDYTPYEWRAVGALVLLGQRERAAEAMDFLFAGQRPPGWRGWAEVVRKDPREPGYIGDMPHTWCGSDFINSVRLMLAYERGGGSWGAEFEPLGGSPARQLVLAAGLPRAWVLDERGVGVDGLVTPFGPLRYTVRRDAERPNVGVLELRPLDRWPPGGVVVAWPDMARIAAVRVDGEPSVHGHGEVHVTKAPARVEVEYRP